MEWRKLLKVYKVGDHPNSKLIKKKAHLAFALGCLQVPHPHKTPRPVGGFIRQIRFLCSSIKINSATATLKHSSNIFQTFLVKLMLLISPFHKAKWLTQSIFTTDLSGSCHVYFLNTFRNLKHIKNMNSKILRPFCILSFATMLFHGLQQLDSKEILFELPQTLNVALTHRNGLNMLLLIHLTSLAGSVLAAGCS